jgi:membrane protein YqaA with SNARE-associated domain
MLRRLYDWTMRSAATLHAPKVLGAIAFAESSFFPIPPDVLLVPMILSNRARAWWYALVCTSASVLGALAGYLIGAVLFDAVAMPLLTFYGYAHKFAEFAEVYNDWGAWIVLVAGVTPFPFKVVTVASGATGLDLFAFVIFSIIARGTRFYAVASLLYYFGPPVREFIEQRLGLVLTAGLAALIGGFLLLKVVL